MTTPAITMISCRLAERSRTYAPLGPMYIVAALEERGYQVQFIDQQLVQDANLFNVPGFVETLLSAESEVVGISLFADALPLVLTAIRVYEAQHGHKCFILGGPGVNGNECTILEKFPEIWAVVRGEGETTVACLLEAFAAHTVPQRPGIYTRDAAGNPQGLPPVRIQDIDSLPWPDYTHLDATCYSTMSVVTSRGCPFNCSFCEIITMWGRSTSFRSIPDVISELRFVVDTTGQRNLNFIDDTFTLKKKRVIDLCQAIVAAKLDIHWTCFSRIDTINEDMLEAMAEAGCQTIFFGIDTGSELMWRNINKKLSRSQVLAVVGKTLQYCGVVASYIWGYPDETFDDFVDTMHLAYEVACLPVHHHKLVSQLHFLSPTRSTPIYDQHHDTLAFSEAVPLEICGMELRRFRHVEGYARCLELITSDSELFAPYYYYQSQQLERKLAIMRKAGHVATEIVGEILLSENHEKIFADRLQKLQNSIVGRSDEEVTAMVAIVIIASTLSRY